MGVCVRERAAVVYLVKGVGPWAATDADDDDATGSSYGAPRTLRLYRRGRLPWDGLLLINPRYNIVL